MAPQSPGRFRQLWADLREDASFRATFLGAIVLPAVCAFGLVAWIVFVIVRG